MGNAIHFNKAAIISILNNAEELLSNNQISQELGFTKSNTRVLSMLEEMVEDGVIFEEVHDRGFAVYGLEEDFSDVEVSEDASESNASLEVPDSNLVPENLFGYQIRRIPVSENSEYKYEVTLPDGRVSYITDGQKIAVINPEDGEIYAKLVPSGSNQLDAAQQYAYDKGFHSYVVVDPSTGRYIPMDGDESEKSEAIIVFYNVRRHNKAAA